MRNNSFLQISLILGLEWACTNQSFSGAFKIIHFGFKIGENLYKKQQQSYYLLVPNLFYPLLGVWHFKDFAIGWW